MSSSPSNPVPSNPTGLAPALKPPTYHRQKLLLFLIELTGGRLSKMNLQKLLFLYIQESETKHYAFVPYRFGCYSFLAADDLDLLQKRGWLTRDDKHLELNVNLARHSWAVESGERRAVQRWLAKNPLRDDALIRDVYRRYPYYASRSEIKEKLLTEHELAQVRHASTRQDNSGQILFTLGYEGIHLEDYINKLLHNGVKLVCDVRANPLSRKFGFSQRSLATLLPKLGIAYQHVPELGIESESRKHLNNSDDYEALFASYAEALPTKESSLGKVLELLKERKHIALTCFEKEPRSCHRHCITDYLSTRRDVTVIHL